MDYNYLFDTIRQNQSVAAVNESGEILAVRLGIKQSRDQWFAKWMETTMISFVKKFGPILPKSTEKLNIFIDLLERVEFDSWAQFDKLGCDHIYEDKAVCSSRKHGIRGLGSEIVRRSELLGADLGCTHTYAVVTGIFQQIDFEKLNKI